MYKIEQNVVFLNEALSYDHGIIYKIDDETGHLLQEPLPAPRKPEQESQAPGKAIYSNKSPRKRGGSNS